MGGSCARAATRGGEGSHVVLVEVGFRLELKDDDAQRDAWSGVRWSPHDASVSPTRVAADLPGYAARRIG